MKFILNLSVDPHFCALVRADGSVAEYQEWADRKQDGTKVWDFLQIQSTLNHQIDFLGCVSGPGGFSSLRAAAGIMHALGHKLQLPIHTVRSDAWLSALLQHNQIRATLLLNSFSNKVFLCQDSEIAPYEIKSVQTKLQDQVVYVGCLPSHKQEIFPDGIKTPLFDSIQILAQVLTNTKPQTYYVPDYAFAAIL